jgi:uncharacterized membrane protein|tara:strand:- start:56 stop:706 length:651 start_codon:yes stop_codon:yes gene_type:complete
MEVLEYLPRWGHYIFGVTWIGLLYYFNFIQGGYMASASNEAKVSAFTKLVPNALWYFRFAALFTFLTGIILLYQIHTSRLGPDILIGVIMGTLMFLNVWGIIWPNQKIVIASNESVAAGGEADPNQASAAAKALLASRTNTLFSMPMLFYMGSAHWSNSAATISGSNLGFVLALLIIAALEVNAIVGKLGPITTVKGVIGSSLALTVVFLVLSSVL